MDDELYGLDQSGVVNLLGKLNGERHTLLCVKREDGWVLFIGGGGENSWSIKFLQKILAMK